MPSLSTVHRLINKDPSFAKQIIQARKVGCPFYLDKMIDELETISNKDVGIVREAASLSLASIKAVPGLYGDKQK